MAGDISVALRADAKPFGDGVRQAEDAVDRFVDAVENGADNADEAFADVIRKLVELGRQSGKTRDELVKDLQKLGLGAEDAEDSIRAIERETQSLGRDGSRDVEKAADSMDDLADAADDAGDAARKAGDDVGTVGDSASPVGDKLRDLGDIARDVLSGDFSSATDGALSALSGLAAAAGVGGAVGSAVASAVSGLVSQLVESWDPFSTKTKEVAEELAGALVQVGGAFDEAMIEQRLRDAAADTETWNQATLLAAATGLSLGDSLRAVAGIASEESATAFQALQDAMNDSSSSAQNLNLRELRGLEQTLAGNAGAADEASSRQRALADAMAVTEANAQRANEKIAAAGELLKQPLPQPAPVKLQVDDSAIRNYRPPVINVPTRMTRVTWE